MHYKSLGEFVEIARSTGDVKVIQGADLDLDVGCLTELAVSMDGPLLLFERFRDFREDFRLVSNVFDKSLRRYALALGLPTHLRPLELVKLLRERKRTRRPVPPVEVPDGPILEHVLAGDDVDVTMFPAPTWHSGDGGRYIGTGDIVVTRDPETGWVNFGTFRACVQGRDRVTLWIIKNKRTRIIAEKYWTKNVPCPVAVVLGLDPALFMVSTSRSGVNKYEEAGALHGVPIHVVKGPLTGLPIPAHGEIVLEGEIPSPDAEAEFEGPFGEWPGYYSHYGRECVVRVKRIAYRTSPIIHGAPPLRPMLSWHTDLPGITVNVWDHLERSGITDVVGVWGFCHGLMIVISLRQRYAGHAKQALLAACGMFSGGGSMFRYYVAVDDDIDPSDMRDVLWALCTRVDPSTCVEMVRSWTSDLDPRLSPEQKAAGDYTMGRMMIDACKPYHWRDSFPKTNIFSPEERDRVKKQYASLLEEMAKENLKPKT